MARRGEGRGGDSNLRCLRLGRSPARNRVADGSAEDPRNRVRGSRRFFAFKGIESTIQPQTDQPPYLNLGLGWRGGRRVASCGAGSPTRLIPGQNPLMDRLLGLDLQCGVREIGETGEEPETGQRGCRPRRPAKRPDRDEGNRGGDDWSGRAGDRAAGGGDWGAL